MSEIGKSDAKPTFQDYARAHELMARGDLLEALAEAVALERTAREALAEAQQDAFDERTGLPMPAVAIRRANRIIGEIERSRGNEHNRLTDPTGAVAFMTDIVDFKKINARRGYPGGDSIIKAKADFLSEIIRDTDVLTRWGGDEFVIFAPIFQGLHEDEVVSVMGGRLTAIPQSSDFPSQIRWGWSIYQPGDDLARMLSRIDITTDPGKQAAQYSDKNLLFSLD